MILTCPECQTQYKLDPGMLGLAGREVRCVGCRHTWFQLPETALPSLRERTAETTVSAPPDSAESLTSAMGSVLEEDDAVFEEILSSVSRGEQPTGGQTLPPPEETRLISRPEPQLPIVTHNPFGVSATAFGLLVFTLLVSLTLTAVFMGRNTLIHRFPQISMLYNAIGFNIKAPGEGLRLSELRAEQRITGQKKELVVEGKMTNMTEHEVTPPALHVTLKSGQDAVMKIWDIKPAAAGIASGEVVPVVLQLTDAPEDGFSVEVRVKDE